MNRFKLLTTKVSSVVNQSSLHAARWKFKPKRIQLPTTKTIRTCGISGICDARPSRWPTFNGNAHMRRNQSLRSIEMHPERKHTLTPITLIKQMQTLKHKRPIVDAPPGGHRFRYNSILHSEDKWRKHRSFYVNKNTFSCSWRARRNQSETCLYFRRHFIVDGIIWDAPSYQLCLAPFDAK